MSLDIDRTTDPDNAGIPTEARPIEGHWYDIEVRILEDRYRSLGAEELALNWLPEHSVPDIQAKASELGL